MQFLKTLFWMLVLGLAIAFAFANWVPVSVKLWGGLVADVNLPFLLLIAFALGYLPMLLVYHAMRWRMRQRLTALERAVEDLRAPPPPPPAPAAPEAPAAVELP